MASFSFGEWSWMRNIIPVEPESFLPVIQDYSWSGVDIIDNNPDSTLAVMQNEGPVSYSFSASDEFGCSRDTAINFNVLPEGDPACVKCETRFCA